MERPRLLVVDDNNQVGEVVVEIAALLGYDARYTDDFMAFARDAQGWEPAAIVTDLQMPTLDGVALFRHLANAGSKSRIVIISGMAGALIDMAARIARERGLDVVATLRKPFNVAELSEVLEGLKPPATIPPDVLRTALFSDEIETYFQPKCSIDGRRLVGAEVLARWNHPLYGSVSPSVFIPIVEQHGMAGPFLERIMGRALRHVARWHDAGTHFPVAINVSSHNVADINLPDHLEDICVRHGVACEDIVLELTENASVDLSADTMEVLARLRLKGFHLSIDDFGTGFSSLQRLKDMPFTELKIDRSFIANIHQDAISSVIVKSVVSLARQLGLTCVAEGIEDPPTVRLLAQLGCEFGQGYEYGRPMPPFLFGDYLARISGENGAAPAAPGISTDAA